MKNKHYKALTSVLLIIGVILLLFIVVSILELYGSSLPVSEEAGAKFRFNLDYVKANFSSLNNKDVRIVTRDVDNGSAEAKRYPLIGYEIIIDPEDLQNVGDFELQGLFSHELSHIEYYSEISWLQLGIFAVRYFVSNDFKKKVEGETDFRAIEKGFGEELLAFRENRLTTGSENDNKILIDYYLSPEEI